MNDLFELVLCSLHKIKLSKEYPLKIRRIENGGVHVVGYFTIHRVGKYVGDPNGSITFNGLYDFGQSKKLANQIKKDAKEWIDGEK